MLLIRLANTAGAGWPRRWCHSVEEAAMSAWVVAAGVEDGKV
jgi:hypothetical protein